MAGVVTSVDNSTALRLFMRRDGVLESWKLWRFREDFLRKHGLTAAPFEDARHFTPQSAADIAKACRSEGFLSAHVIPLIDEPRCCYRAILTNDAFEALGDIETIWTHFLVLEENDRFAIICDELFNTISGSPRFVESALGRKSASACTEFLKDFVDEAMFPEHEKAIFRELVTFYDRT